MILNIHSLKSPNWREIKYPSKIKFYFFSSKKSTAYKKYKQIATTKDISRLAAYALSSFNSDAKTRIPDSQNSFVSMSNPALRHTSSQDAEPVSLSSGACAWSAGSRRRRHRPRAARSAPGARSHRPAGGRVRPRWSAPDPPRPRG